jgi:uncharacterized membrane protein YdbT with pleckstrin-like domain
VAGTRLLKLGAMIRVLVPIVSHERALTPLTVITPNPAIPDTEVAPSTAPVTLERFLTDSKVLASTAIGAFVITILNPPRLIIPYIDLVSVSGKYAI